MRAARAITLLTAGLAVTGAGAQTLAGPAPVAMRGLRAESGIFAPLGNRLSPNFRVRTSLGPFATPSLIGADDRVRQRIASSMFDLYPAGGDSGLHVSGGVRYYRRVNLAIAAQNATHGLLYVPNWRSGGGSRAGFRRFAPAATLGYSGVIGGEVLVGVEAGALIGRAMAAEPRGLRDAGRWMGERPRGGLNELASLVVGLRF